MKSITSFNALAVAIMLGAAARGFAQTTFTKITEGDLVNDSGGFVGAAWGDFDKDGLLDVFLSHYSGVNTLYRNDGNGSFTKITQAAPVQDIDAHTVPSWGDYDNDGNPDLLVPAGLWSPQRTHVRLYQNNGDGTLNEVSAGNLSTELGYFVGNWVDYDNDGFLDVFVGNSPGPNQGGKGSLLHNNGDGTFTKTELTPLTSDSSVNFANLSADYDNDGFVDLVILNNKAQAANLLYHNQGNGIFTRVLTGAIATDPGAEYASGGAWGDYDNDGFPDLFVATDAAGPNRLFHNNGDGTFTKVTSGPMLSHPAGASSITCAWGDYDNDGYLDLFVSNRNAGNQLFHNSGNGTFTQILSGWPVDDSGPGVSTFGASWVDFDNDGFLDLLVLGPTPKLFYHNDGNANAWLEIKCDGTVSNRSAIGAKVRVRATIGGKTFWQTRQINAGGGYNTAPLVAHFGLGNATNVEVLRIEWPSGSVQEVREVPAKQILTLTEPPRLSMSLATGVPQITLKGGRGFRYRIEASDDLRVWSLFGDSTITNLSGTVSFADASLPASARRFYRSIQVAQ
ncbi:MAG: CRTAC1 family protein [Verrucomicrobiales bacterium]|nr:CRTAC1 family protein [Verrucomicrobiales bacterium]